MTWERKEGDFTDGIKEQDWTVWSQMSSRNTLKDNKWRLQRVNLPLCPPSTLTLSKPSHLWPPHYCLQNIILVKLHLNPETFSENGANTPAGHSGLPLHDPHQPFHFVPRAVPWFHSCHLFFSILMFLPFCPPQYMTGTISRHRSPTHSRPTSTSSDSFPCMNWHLLRTALALVYLVFELLLVLLSKRLWAPSRQGGSISLFFLSVHLSFVVLRIDAGPWACWASTLLLRYISSPLNFSLHLLRQFVLLGSRHTALNIEVVPEQTG